MSFQGGRTMFGRVPEKNVYFLIDTSGSMYHQLAFVKQHLVELLSNRATVSQDSMFNVIEFKEDVDKWADKLVQCTPSTVTVAARWINKLTCGTSTNTMGALLEALNDSAVEAIYMVTDGLPDQRPTVILEKLRSIPHSTPIHSIYLNGTYSDPATHGFLRDLAEQTRGSFHTVTLSHNGSVEKVVLVYNRKTSYAQHYDISLDKLGQNDVESKYIGLVKPPASGYVSRIYEKSPIITAVDKSLCLPVSYGLYNGHATSGGSTMDSKVLDYADAVIEARGLAKAAGIRCCSTPVACSLMKGVKVLARRDRDGLYYFGEVKEQGPNDSFVVKFDACSTVRKAVVQETSVHHMIAYKDAIRSHVSLGDKVLAPWQQDGCYGPGTVLEGVDRRDAQTEGCEDGRLLVTFFNGETVELQPGIAVRIPKYTFDRIVKELQLPESQRRKLKFCERNIPLTFASVAPPQSLPPAERYTSSVHKRAWEHEQTKKDSDKLRKRVDDQINENSYLLHALDLTSGIRSPKVIGKATSRDIPNYDSGVFSEDESGTSDDDSRRMSYDDDFRFDYEVGTRNKEYDLDFSTRFSLPEAKVLSKSGGEVEPTKRWRWWSTGVPARQPRFRETLLRKPREPGEKLTDTVRPTHEEYQTVAGVSFPAGTDRKFGSERQQWHPYRQFSVHRKENISAVVGVRKHQKHSEYQDVAGVGFPRATDKKFTRSLDPNWRPETAALRNAGTSQNWEDGLGHGDVLKNAQYADKLERKGSNKRRYFKDIEDKVAIEEKKEAKRTEFRRNKMTQRDENLAESEAEKNRQIAERVENKTAKQAEILRSEQERTDNAEKWKTTRIEVRRDRQAKYFEIEGNYESDEQARVAKREARRRNRESMLREEFHERVREEWRTEDERVEFLRQKNEANRERASKRQQGQEQMKQARFSAKQERLEKYRAIILP